jgi:hypothetical protein
MNTAIAIGVGAALGAILVLRLRPTTESSCCDRVRQGIRDKLSSACGPLGPACSGLAEGLGLVRSGPDLLDTFGVP